MSDKSFLQQEYIEKLLENNSEPQAAQIDELLSKALELKGLNINEVSVLLNISNKESLDKLYNTALKIKEEIYGNRLVLFAPLYVSNFCANNCLYCGFRIDNKKIQRRLLTLDEIKEETLALLEQGHKRTLMLMGENHQACSLDYFINAIEAVYSVKDSKGSSIRRINVEISPLTKEEFQILKDVKIGTYTVFQETYHRKTYEIMHPSGWKANYDWRLLCMDRALQNGMHDVGIGVLFGLYDYKFEVLSMILHANHLDKEYNIGPHTISIPRIQPASDAPASINLKHKVSDDDFKKLVAVIRCAVPYTGMILSTREPAYLRSELFNLGISQISAGSKTNPGGYKQAFTNEVIDDSQFELNDCRSSGEIIRDVLKQGFIPSFCTACYRLGRVGEDFMDQAKPGLIKLYCQPNALTTLKEYLVDYADEETRLIGEEMIQHELDAIPNEGVKNTTSKFLKQIENGERDLYL
jgi:2-iminoacetate synthase